jgi:hypothetical protein
MRVTIRDRRHWWTSKIVVWRADRLLRGQRRGNGILRRVERLVRRVETVLRSTLRQGDGGRK